MNDIGSRVTVGENQLPVRIITAPVIAESRETVHRIEKRRGIRIHIIRM